MGGPTGSKTAEAKGPRETAVAPPRPGCTLYLGRLPHGFYEDEIRAYFSQFGPVTRVRVSRNRRTGAAKHYAFLELEHPEVARIVAETMDNYLLFGHLLQCRVVPEARLHAGLFLGANRRFTVIPWRRIAAAQYNGRKGPEPDKQRQATAQRVAKVREQCKALGIEYDFDSVVTTAVTTTATTEAAPE